MTPSVEVVDLGTTGYADTLALQRELFDKLVEAKNGTRERGERAGSGEDRDSSEGRDCREGRDSREGGGEGNERDENNEAGWIVMCEHPHVYTLGRSGKLENLLVGEDSLRERGAELHMTDRGGDITYHGPGQIVCYPVVDLDKIGLSLREYIAALEQSVIATVAHFGIGAGRVEGKTGVWVGTGATESRKPERKICAIGVRSSRMVTMHGLALNVSTDLGWFEHINPCGLAGGRATSMEAETAGKISMDEVKRVLCEKLGEILKVNI